MQLTAYMYTRSDVRHAVSTRYLPKHHNCISNAWTPNNDCWYKWSVWLKPNIPNLEFGLISCVHGYVVNFYLPEPKKRYYYSNEILRRQLNKILHISWWRLYFFRRKTSTNVYDTIRRGWGMFAWLSIYAYSSCVLILHPSVQKSTLWHFKFTLWQNCKWTHLQFCHLQFCRFATLSITGSHTLTFFQTLYNTTSLLVREEKDVSALRVLSSGKWQ